MRSRVAGMRLTMSIGASSLAVWLLGPLVKRLGAQRLTVMGLVSSTLAYALMGHPAYEITVLAQGVAASPGAAKGEIVFTAPAAVEAKAQAQLASAQQAPARPGAKSAHTGRM